jgi:AcrR family transcriptional regulator
LHLQLDSAILHCVLSSATGLRERRRAETFGHLNATARRLTAERGLAGFTVEELCESVGVSRRTFFNYFASKEDAVLGLSVRHDHAAAEEHFVAGGGARGRASGDVLSATLVEDLAELLIDRWELMDLTREDARDLMAAFEREPRLFSRVLELTRTQERGDIALVQQREHLPAGDLRAAAVVHVLGAVLRMSVAAFLDPTTDEPFRDTFAHRLAAARTVLTT